MYCAILAMSEPHGCFPSLRTHKPNPAERDPSGPCRQSAFQNTSLAACNNRLIVFSAMREPNLWDDTSIEEIEMRQLTNLRMRTFIATPSARNVNSTEDPP
jgi:hypothetical protein